jgi:hypothetical protein
MSKSLRNAPVYNRTRTNKPQPALRSNKAGLFLALGGGVLVILALFFALSKPQPPSVSGSPVAGDGPHFTADKNQVDLGDLKLGSTADVSFTLTNSGSTPLKFSQAPYVEVKEGC